MVSSILASLISLQMVLAEGMVGRVFDRVIGIGNLGFLGLGDGPIVVGLTRLLLWALMFTLFFGVLTGFGARGSSSAVSGATAATGWASIFTKNQALVVSFILATIASIFMPVQVVLAVGGGWSTALALLLIGGPILGLGYVMWTKIPSKDVGETRGHVAIKLGISLLLFYILSAMRVHIGRLGASTKVSTVLGSSADFIEIGTWIVIAMIVWYIIRLFMVDGMTSSERDDHYERQGEHFRETVQGAVDRGKQRHHVKARGHQLRGALARIIEARRTARSLAHHLRGDLNGHQLDQAKHSAERLQKKCEGIVRFFEGAATRVHGDDQVRQSVHHLHSYAETLVHHVQTQIEDPLNGDDVNDFNRRHRAGVVGHLTGTNGVVDMLAWLRHHVDHMIREGRHDSGHAAPGSTPP